MTLDLQSNPSTLADICRTFGVRRLSVFGSAARGELRPESDVDLLVEYKAGITPSFFKLVDLSEQLRPIFGGRNIDLVLPSELHWFIRDQVLDSARSVYEG